MRLLLCYFSLFFLLRAIKQTVMKGKKRKRRKFVDIHLCKKFEHRRFVHPIFQMIDSSFHVFTFSSKVMKMNDGLKTIDMIINASVFSAVSRPLVYLYPNEMYIFHRGGFRFTPPFKKRRRRRRRNRHVDRFEELHRCK